MNRKNKDGEKRQVARPVAECKHPHKEPYGTNDGQNHWICRDCAATDLDV